MIHLSTLPYSISNPPSLLSGKQGIILFLETLFNRRKSVCVFMTGHKMHWKVVRARARLQRVYLFVLHSVACCVCRWGWGDRTRPRAALTPGALFLGRRLDQAEEEETQQAEGGPDAQSEKEDEGGDFFSFPFLSRSLADKLSSIKDFSMTNY